MPMDMPMPDRIGAPWAAGETLRIGLVNNMPDAALRRTEQQFHSLLGAAGETRPIELVMVTLPQIERSDWAAAHVAQSYLDLPMFLDAELDAVIVTGAEPRAAALPDEPYWGALTSVFDWIDEAQLPSAYCCLAAHAAVLHRDGIARRRLPRKCSGIFDHVGAIGHPLTDGATAPHKLPHSRWNEITAHDLAGRGYVVLSHSDDVGVGAFARDAGARELYFQGHPEYGGTTLLREYRRDVRRFLTGERDTYPDPPSGVAQMTDWTMFDAFQAQASRDRDPALFDAFPSFAAADARALPWRPTAARVYANWLASVAAHVPSPQV